MNRFTLTALLPVVAIFTGCVSIRSPVEGQTVGDSVRVVADVGTLTPTASGRYSVPDGDRIAKTEILIDGVVEHTTTDFPHGVARVEATIPVARGRHRLVVRATERDGGVTQASKSFDATGQVADHVITAAGDIGDDSPVPFFQDETARLITQLDPGTVLTIGDHAYPNGTLEDFNRTYDPWWGAFKAKTRPVPGNHEQHSRDVGYDAYFGAGRHNYSYDRGNWHLIALDTNSGDSSALAFLRDDLTRQPAGTCLLMYMHHPLHSSGVEYNGGVPGVRELYDAFYAYGGDLVLSGHEHNYERFGLQDPSKRATPNGYRQIVAGTGGKELRRFGAADANSQVRLSHHGVVKVILKPRSYKADFVGILGARDDVPETACHG